MREDAPGETTNNAVPTESAISANKGNRTGLVVGLILIAVGFVVGFFPAIQCPPSRGYECGAAAFEMFVSMPIGAIIGIIGIVLIATTQRNRNKQ
jgi:uncharacterized membrane protein HdeD (DUF308 family)